MKSLPNDYSHRWNDLPSEYQTRLEPFIIEDQIRHILRMRYTLTQVHKRTLAELDDHIKNLEADLREIERKSQ